MYFIYTPGPQPGSKVGKSLNRHQFTLFQIAASYWHFTESGYDNLILCGCPIWLKKVINKHKQIYILIIMIKQATRLKRKGVDNLQLWSTRSGQNKRNTCSVLYNWRTEARGKLSIWAWFIWSLGGSTVFVQVLLWLCPFTANVWCLCSYYRD